MDKGNQDDDQCAKRAKRHCESPAGAKRMAAAHGIAREPSAADAAHGSSDVDDDERQTEQAHLDVEALMEELGQPIEIKPPDRVGGSFGKGKCQGSPGLQERLEGGSRDLF
jgi:hypothetical protein